MCLTQPLYSSFGFNQNERFRHIKKDISRVIVMIITITHATAHLTLIWISTTY